MQGDPSLAYMAVYDGHGGTGVANYLKDHLHEFILAQPEYRWDGNSADGHDDWGDHGIMVKYGDLDDWDDCDDGELCDDYFAK